MKHVKILVWHGKHGDVMVCARTPEEEAKAWLHLFKMMDDNCYYDCGLDGDEVDAYKAAKEGDARGAEWLLGIRSDCEYERVDTEYVTVLE